MADLTTQQEDVSKEFFQVFLDDNWDPSDEVYEDLISTCFGRRGIFPLGGLKPNVAADWRSSYDKQILALQQYMMPRSISASGWVWSRGDGMMGFLNGIAKDRCGVKGSLDSWNPMDIVGVLKDKEAEIQSKIEADIINGVDEDTNKDLLNGLMIEYIQKKYLMPVSLKKIVKKERAAMELSDDLKGRNAKLRAKHHFKYSNFQCDLEWSTYHNEWKTAQEISWDMKDSGSITRVPSHVHVQARAFQASPTRQGSREKPQHSLAPVGGGAMLGKATIKELEKFIDKYKVSAPHSPGSHPKIPSAGKEWTKQHKQYWIALYNKLKTITIDGKKIDFGTPGSYGEGTRDRKLGFDKALDSACKADQEGTKTRAKGRSSGSRLTAKLWGMEWLWRYYNMSKRGTWDAFAYRIYKAAKKELPGMGPFIKIYGQSGRSRKEIKKHIETFPDHKIDWDNILDEIER